MNQALVLSLFVMTSQVPDLKDYYKKENKDIWIKIE